MTLKERITAEMKDAMRARDAVRLGTIRLLLAAIQRKEVDERITLDDAQVMAVVEKLIKQGKESAAQYAAASRDDLLARELAEIAIYKEYLPEQMSEVEIDALIQAAIAETGAASVRDMGKIMGVLKPKMQGRADMSAVSARIKAALGG